MKEPEEMEKELWQENNKLRAKVSQYESYLHMINAAVVAMNHETIQRLVGNAFRWSYAHRSGNGMLSEEEQQERVKRAFDKLLDV